MFFRLTSIFVLTYLFSLAVIGQETYTPLATMEGRSFTVQDLPSNASSAWMKLPATLSQAKTELLELQIDRILLQQAANKRSMSVDELIEVDVNKKVPDPDENAIKKLYDENKAEIGDTPLSEIRVQLVKFLRIEPEKKAHDAYTAKLRAAAKIEYVKDLNAERLVEKDVFAMVNDEPITQSRFVKRNGLSLYEYEANVYDLVESSLRMIVDAAVYQLEAQNLTIPVNELIKREVTSRMTVFSPEESSRLERTLKDRLYQKYRVKFFITEPKPFIQDVSADDDPFIGKANAAVTVVVFADYECPACAAIHSVIKDIVAKEGDRVRLVFRDFPLTKVHDFAFSAALAANAANRQGKFFEYTELLYSNQDQLDNESLVKYAGQIGLDVSKFSADLVDPANEAEVKKDMADGEALGVAGTPSIFVNGYKVRALSYPAITGAIQKALAGQLK